MTMGLNTKETTSRLDQIHDLVLEIYPELTGVDAVWHRTAGVGYFGAKRPGKHDQLVQS